GLSTEAKSSKPPRRASGGRAQVKERRPMNSHRQPASRLAHLLIPALMLGAALTIVPASAQDAAAPAAPTAEAAPAVTPETVVATVAGETITEADFSFAAEDLAHELQQMPADQRKAFLVTVLIDMKVM